MNGCKEAVKMDIMEMFSLKRGSGTATQGDGEAEKSRFARLVMREAVELAAPVFWITSITKVVDLVKQVFVFLFSLFGFYQVVHWLLTGVPASWWLILQVPAALFGVMMAMMWLGRSA